MARLTGDCFAFGGPLLAIDDVERLIGERVTPVVETERVALKDARGRVLASDLVAAIDLPPFDNSAVRGHAWRRGPWAARGVARRRGRGPRGGARDQRGRALPYLPRGSNARRGRHGVYA